jgi:uncharacterized protein (DUF433 family)
LGQKSVTVGADNVHSKVLNLNLETMSLTATEYKYIQIDECNGPFIAGTTMKVVELITPMKAYGWSPENFHEQHPYLTMGQIYSALAYYWDLERRYQLAEQLRREAGESPIAKKLAAMGLLP